MLIAGRNDQSVIINICTPAALVWGSQPTALQPPSTAHQPRPQAGGHLTHTSHMTAGISHPDPDIGSSTASTNAINDVTAVTAS
jgi:hypothetical protein